VHTVEARYLFSFVPSSPVASQKNQAAREKGKRLKETAASETVSTIEMTAKKLPGVPLGSPSCPVQLCSPHGSIAKKSDHMCLPPVHYIVQ